jgi:phospholipase C
VTRGVAVVVALTAMSMAAPATSGAAAAIQPKTPIEHFVVLMQENHSFDNYFGTYRGADGVPKRTCMPIGRARAATHGRGPCVRPFRLSGREAPDFGHDRRIHEIQYAGGRMDGFVRAASIGRQRVEPSVMGYYDGRDLPFYWNVADDYVLFDRFFSSAADGSVANHLFWVTGTPGPTEGTGDLGDLPTIFDRLEERGISWKFYVEDYDPADRGVQAVRVPLLRYSRYVEDPTLFSHIVDLEQYYADLERGSLPQVAYIAPAGASEHPPGRLEAGATLVRRLVNALARSTAWERSAFMWTYDDWGGWFDHVRPPKVDGTGFGFRVPALLVSPYARRGHVDSTRLDTTSILRFIEDNWGLEPLARRDAQAGSFARAFDFSRPPRAPSILAAARPSAEAQEPRRGVIYLTYGAAVLLSAVFLTLAFRAAPRRSRTAGIGSLSVLLVLWAAPASAQVPAGGAPPPTIRTVPEAPGMRFSLDGMEFAADRDGRAHPPAPAGRSLMALDTEIAPGVRARFDRWYSGGRIAAINLYYRVEPGFVDLSGERVDPGVVSSVVLRGSNGRRHVFSGGHPQWLQGNRVIPETGGERSTALSYSVERALVAGSTVVHRAQQRFFPAESRRPELRLLLFSARFKVRDALLGFPIGSAVRLEYPNGQEQQPRLGRGGDLTVTSLPRGDYRVSVDAPGISSSRPLALSSDQEVELRVISWLDVGIVLMGLVAIALVLLFIRRPARALGRGRRVAATVVLLLGLGSAADAPPARAASRPDQLYAYYYIWFNASSWNRAKTDYPLLGRYSSDEREVMRRHVQWAKRAGIDGFIVSWKSTPILNRRLERLAEVAAAQRFKLLVIYQGLDFERRPLPAARIASDLDTFIDRYSGKRVFEAFGRPLVIWSGTPSFTRAELARVASPRRRRLLILASERNPDGYRRVADLVDGNAYYWGSVNPSTYPGYPEKLAAMGAAIHARGGLWIAPAAPGFDARLVGGREVVARRDGATLRAQLDAATSSAPDAVGLISWNEFSENTHIEPSRAHGSRYLEVLADVRGASLPELRDFDSSEPAATGVNYGLPLLGGIVLFFSASLLVLIGRGRRRAPPRLAPDRDG